MTEPIEPEERDTWARVMPNDPALPIGPAALPAIDPHNPLAAAVQAALDANLSSQDIDSLVTSVAQGYGERTTLPDQAAWPIRNLLSPLNQHAAVAQDWDTVAGGITRDMLQAAARRMQDRSSAVPLRVLADPPMTQAELEAAVLAYNSSLHSIPLSASDNAQTADHREDAVTGVRQDLRPRLPDVEVLTIYGSPGSLNRNGDAFSAAALANVGIPAEVFHASNNATMAASQTIIDQGVMAAARASFRRSGATVVPWTAPGTPPGGQPLQLPRESRTRMEVLHEWIYCNDWLPSVQGVFEARGTPMSESVFLVFVQFWADFENRRSDGQHNISTLHWLLTHFDATLATAGQTVCEGLYCVTQDWMDEIAVSAELYRLLTQLQARLIQVAGTLLCELGSRHPVAFTQSPRRRPIRGISADHVTVDESAEASPESLQRIGELQQLLARHDSGQISRETAIAEVEARIAADDAQQRAVAYTQQRAVEAINGYTRMRVQEQSFTNRILPPSERDVAVSEPVMFSDSGEPPTSEFRASWMLWADSSKCFLGVAGGALSLGLVETGIRFASRTSALNFRPDFRSLHNLIPVQVRDPWFQIAGQAVSRVVDDVGSNWQRVTRTTHTLRLATFEGETACWVPVLSLNTSAVPPMDFDAEATARLVATAIRSATTPIRHIMVTHFGTTDVDIMSMQPVCCQPYVFNKPQELSQIPDGYHRQLRAVNIDG